MLDALVLVAVATATVLATSLGAIPVMRMGARAEALRPVLSGVAIGVMAVAAVVGLLLPALREGPPAVVAAGAAAGAGGLWGARRALRRRIGSGSEEQRTDRAAALTVGVLFVHSLPEGLAIGSAYVEAGSLGLFVILAVAIQNVPEGTATAIAVASAGRPPLRQLQAATLTSVPQIPGALAAYLAVDAVRGLLPASFAAAGAAMLLLVGAELAPTAWRDGHRAWAVAGAALGALVMGGLAVGLAPPA
jgi:zinc transporter, ZIP family